MEAGDFCRKTCRKWDQVVELSRERLLDSRYSGRRVRRPCCQVPVREESTMTGFLVLTARRLELQFSEAGETT